MRAMLVFATATVVFALASLTAGVARAQFEELTCRVPPAANTIVLIDVDKVLDSPMAVAEGWRQDPMKRFAAGLTNIPSDANQMLMAAQMDLELMRPVWELGMVRLEQAPAVADLAARYQGTPDSVAGLPAVHMPDDTYLVRFSDTLLAAHAPGNRQAVSRWLQQPHGTLSPYLNEAIGYAKRGTEFIIAVDLKDAVALHAAREQLAAVDHQALTAAGIDPDELAQLLASVKGVMLGMTFDQRAFGKIKLDFGRDTSLLAGIAKPLFLAILEERGLLIDEFYDWQVKVEDQHIIFGGYLTSSGLMRLSSLIDLPSRALHNLPSPAAEQQAPQSLDPTAAPSPVIEVPVIKEDSAPMPDPPAMPSASDLQQFIEPTRQYFQKVDYLLSDLRRRRRGAKTHGQVGVWYESYARRVDRLPMTNVDDHMLDYGGFVGSRLRHASAAVRLGSVQSHVGQITTVNQGIPDPRFGKDARRGMTLREEAAARAQVRAVARTSAALSVQQIEMEIDTATAEVRRVMAKKYQINL